MNSGLLEESSLPLFVDFASDGYKALIKIGKEAPDILVLDIRMPNMDGKVLLETLKKNTTKDMKIFVSTGYPDDIDKISGLGVNATLLKPFRTRQFVNAIKELFRGIN